jgi:hypothetical protein
MREQSEGSMPLPRSATRLHAAGSFRSQPTLQEQVLAGHWIYFMALCQRHGMPLQLVGAE